MFNSIKIKLLSWLRIGLNTGNQLYPSAESFFGKELILRGATIYGKVCIGDHCKIIDGVTIIADSQIVLGRYVSLNGPNSDIISKINPITIGSFTSIARNVSIQEFNHKFKGPTSYHIQSNVFGEDRVNDIYSNGSIEIGNDVWVGAHSVILSGTKIGDGAIIGANSVVTKDIPPYGIAAGSPAKLISYRFSEEIIARMIELKWWEWPIEKIKANKEFFSEEVTINSIEKIK